MVSLVSDFSEIYRAEKPLFALKSSLMAHAHRGFDWLLTPGRWQWVHKLSHAIINAFTTHPAETRESYFQHLWFTTTMSLRFVFISMVLFLHGVFPFLFTRTASRQVERIYMVIRSRIPEARREAIKAEYDI